VLLLLIISCNGPSTTGPDLMVGRVVSSSGAPVQGLEIASLEASDRTDAEGAFSVRYKDPSRHVHFGRGGAWYQRDYRAADLETEVELLLPQTRNTALHCGQMTCVVEMVWKLGEGFTAKTTAACKPGQEMPLQQIPSETPEITCTEGSTGPQIPISARDEGARITIGAALVPLRVEIRPVDGVAPDACKVRVGDRIARSAGDGFWSAEAAGLVTVSASCDGIPARPREVHVDVGSVALEWTKSGPTLDLEDIAPWLAEVQLVSEVGEGSGWSTKIRESADGTFSLPPLAEGQYRVMGSGQPDATLLAIQPPEPSAPGILAAHVDSGMELLVGRIIVTGDIVEGAIPVEGFK